MDNEKLMREMPVRKLFLKLCIPSIIIMMVIVLYNMTDLYFIGQTGDSTQIAAISLAGPIFSILQGIGTLFGAGGCTAMAIALGKGDHAKIKSVTSFCFYATIGIGLVMSAAGLFCGKGIASLLGADMVTTQHTITYASILLLGAPFVLIANVFTNIIRADGSIKRSMAANGLGTIVNVLLDPLLILTFDMGVAGAAIATVIGNVVSVLYLMFFAVKKQPNISVKIRDFTLKKKVSLNVIRLGLPQSISVLLMSFSTMYANNLFMKYGNVAVSANGISSKVGMFIVMIAMGICAGVQPAISYNFGAGNYQRLYDIIKKTGLLTVVVGTVLTAICFFVKDKLVGIFTPDVTVLAYAQKMVVASFAVGPVYGLYQLNTVFLQGTGKASYAVILAVLRQGVLFVPILFLTDFLIGLDGLIYASAITEIVAICIGTFLSLRWKRTMDAAQVLAQ
ncbi:MAG: MATE family efflux transporter [Clostridiales bacterium]|nr:MATE family efflux transporter [Clostridiales bacterium]